MEKRENQRVALTKRLVRDALLGLLREKEIGRISVRELCAAAGINRSTFYEHYGSQSDVLAELTGGYLAEIAGAIDSADERDRADIVRRVTIVLRYAEENLELSRLLVNNNVDAGFAERLFALPKIQDMLSGALAGVDESERQYYIAFTISGSYRLICDWINSERRASPERQAARTLALARRVCAPDVPRQAE